MPQPQEKSITMGAQPRQRRVSANAIVAVEEEEQVGVLAEAVEVGDPAEEEDKRKTGE